MPLKNIPNYSTPGQRLTAARVNKKLSKTDLAKALGTTYRRILEWETDEKYPSRYIDKLSIVLEIHPEWIKTGRIEYSPHFYQESYWLEDRSLSEEEAIEKHDYIERINLITSVISLDTLKLLDIASKAAYIHDLEKQITADEIIQMLDAEDADLERTIDTIELLKRFESFIKKTLNSKNKESNHTDK